MRPVLQIAHISDLHISARLVEGRLPRVADWIARCADPLPFLGPWARHGMDPHDPTAPHQFERFLSRASSSAGGWSGPTWLVDTGDLTTFGDEESLVAGKRLLNRLGRYCIRTMSLHGNHDAWPEDFPLAPVPTIEDHRTQLRTRHFVQEWPEAPEVYDPPGQKIRIELYGMNSVEHMPHWNVAAMGRIKHDRYWETTGRRRIRGHSLRRLQSQVPATDKPVLRLLAVHHPIARVDRLPHHRVWNGREVASYLRGPHRFHLILSGHTHALYPKHGHLAPTNPEHDHPPLSPLQSQLVVGSLMQRDFSDKMGAPLDPTRWAHQCQLLRIFHDEASSELVVARLLAGRNPGVDPTFEVRPVPGGSGDGREEIRIPISDL